MSLVLSRLLLLFFSICIFALPALAQQPQSDFGISVTDSRTRDSCISCHPADDKARMTRISYMRKTPESWEETIRRMVRSHGLQIDPADARAIVKYLSSHHGLAPEEARPAFYDAERRVVREKIPDESLQQACVKCHTIGRILAQRRKKEEWQLLVNMHLGFYPLTEFQAFRRIQDPSGERPPMPPAMEDLARSMEIPRPGPIPVPPDEPPRPPRQEEQKDPVDRALEYLEKALPLETPEWHAWRANFRQPRLEGVWTLEAYLPGKGRGFGQMTIERETADDEFRTRTTIEFADGERVAMSGRVILYAGYSWRGRSADPSARTNMFKELREVMLLAPDLETLRGRWFTGTYDEFGIDAVLRRAGRDIVISGTDRTRLLAGATATVKVYGANFPTDLTRRDVDFGPGIAINNVRATPTLLAVDLSVAPNAPAGHRDLVLRGKTARRALAVFDRIDYLRVLPEAGMARLGGVSIPKQYQQFEAVAYQNGADKKPGTVDDIELGPVSVVWSVEEFPATFDDDDIRYVGSIDARGLFTPNIEGPNPERRRATNNFGDVTVVATYSGEGAPKPLKARAHLIVTVPLYAIWKQLEVLP